MAHAFRTVITLLACVSCLGANLTTITVPEDLDRIQNATLTAARVILGKSEVQAFEAVFDLQTACENLTAAGSSARPVLLVLFRRFHVPAYGDACPSVYLLVETVSGKEPLELDGSCISAMTDLQWYLADGVRATLRITGLRPGAENQPGTLDFALIPALFPHDTARCPNETRDCLNMTYNRHIRVCIRPFEGEPEFGSCVDPYAREGVHTPVSRANLTIYLIAVTGAVATLLLVGTVCACHYKRRARRRVAKRRNVRVTPEGLDNMNEQRDFHYTRVDGQAVDVKQPQLRRL
ncbi:hypothetical protein SprV_0902743900 [Sparganum proliferum]